MWICAPILRKVDFCCSWKAKYFGQCTVYTHIIMRRDIYRIPICATLLHATRKTAPRPIKTMILCWRKRIDDHSIFNAIYLHFVHQMYHVIRIDRTKWLDVTVKCDKYITKARRLPLNEMWNQCVLMWLSLHRKKSSNYRIFGLVLNILFCQVWCAMCFEIKLFQERRYFEIYNIQK